MTYEDHPPAPDEIIVEPAEYEVALCGPCGAQDWLRAIAVYAGRACYVIYCADCGRSIEENWTELR